MKRRALTWTLVLMAAGLLLLASTAQAYEQYSESRDATNCRACHGDFRATTYTELGTGLSWPDGLHDTHRVTMLSSTCNVCHVNSKFPVLPGLSIGAGGLPGLGCSGCHGRAEDGTGSGTEGYGAGLRQHHWREGVSICAGCHDDADPANFTPVGEDVLPPYYADPDSTIATRPLDPCNDPTNALAPEEDFAGAARGLDNDGDLDFDTGDADCGAVVASVGEAASMALAPLEVTSFAGGNMTVSYGAACSATDNALVMGPLSDVSNYHYTAADCSIGNTGTHTFAPGVGDLFFLVVADNGMVEGSYGIDGAGAERLSDDLQVPPVCPLPQDLPNRCD
jgi:hypothetical protein